MVVYQAVIIVVDPIVLLSPGLFVQCLALSMGRSFLTVPLNMISIKFSRLWTVRVGLLSLPSRLRQMSLLI